MYSDNTATSGTNPFTGSSTTSSWWPYPADNVWVWEVVEEEPDKPKCKAPRPERKHNQIQQQHIHLPEKQHAKQMYSSQRWNR